MINLIVAPTVEAGRKFQSKHPELHDWLVTSPVSIERGHIRGVTIGDFALTEGAVLDYETWRQIRVRQSTRR